MARSTASADPHPPARDGIPAGTTAERAYRDVFEELTDKASFLWILRGGEVNQPHRRPADIANLDQRLQIAIEGLATVPALGWEACINAMQDGHPGATFTATVVAYQSEDPEKIHTAVQSGINTDAGFKASVSALGWLPASLVHPWIETFLAATPLDHQYLALGAFSVRRMDPGHRLARILQRDDCRAHAKLYARALRLAGELKRHDLRPAVETALDAADERVRFWAAWSAALLGDTAAATPLQQAATSPAYRDEALAIALRTLPPSRARDWIDRLAHNPAHRRTAVQAAGILGDPLTVDWLIEQMQDIALARVAGEAFTLITGIEIERQHLTRTIPRETVLALEDSDLGNALDDINLPWPDPDKTADYWRAQRDRLQPEQRHFLGQPVSVPILTEQIDTGYQRQRRAAAYELALHEPTWILINTEGRPPTQPGMPR